MTYKVRLHRMANESFGIVAHRPSSLDRFCYIESMSPDGTADRSKQLREGDRILEINSLKCPHEDTVERICATSLHIQLTIERMFAANAFQIPVLQSPTNSLSRPVERKPLGSLSILETVPESSVLIPTTPSPPWSRIVDDKSCFIVTLRSDGGGYGFSLRGGYEFGQTPLVILRIQKNSPAFRNSNIQVGDEVLAINGRSTSFMTFEEAAKAIKSGRGRITLRLRRISPDNNYLSF